MTDRMERATARVLEAMDRVVAAWEAEHPEQPIRRANDPLPPAWHPDPNQAPVTTRQWAEVTRLRATELRREGYQAREQAALARQATEELLSLLQPPPEGEHPGHFTRVGPAILMRPPTTPATPADDPATTG